LNPQTVFVFFPEVSIDFDERCAGYSDGVHHGHDITILGNRFVIGRDHAKAKEHKHPHQSRAIRPVVLEAHKDLLTLQLLFGKLE